MSEQAGSEAMQTASPNRLVDAPPEYPTPRGRVAAAEVTNPFSRLGWLLTSGTEALEFLPDVLGDAEPALQGWVREALRACRLAGQPRDEALAAVAAIFAVAEATPVDDPDGFRAAALPR